MAPKQVPPLFMRSKPLILSNGLRIAHLRSSGKTPDCNDTLHNVVIRSKNVSKLSFNCQAGRGSSSQLFVSILNRVSLTEVGVTIANSFSCGTFLAIGLYIGKCSSDCLILAIL